MNYLVSKYRNISQEKLEAFEDFLFWLEYDADHLGEAELPATEARIEQYLGYTMDGIKSEELKMLEQWTSDTVAK